MRKPHLPSVLRSTRTRAVLSLGAVLGISMAGTFAFWTDGATVNGGTLTSGTIQLQAANTVGGTPGDNISTTTLTSANMVPGNSVAQVIELSNQGNVPLKWTLKGGLTGANAAAFSTAGALRLTITDGAPTGTAPARTCTAGSITYVNDVALTTVTTADLIATRQAAIAGNGGAKALCIAVKLADNADQATLSGGKVAATVFSFTGTSDLS